MEGIIQQDLNSSQKQALEVMLHGISKIDINIITPKNHPTSRRIISEDQAAINRILENSPKR